MGNVQCCSADGGAVPPVVDAEGEPLFEHTQDKAMSSAAAAANADKLGDPIDSAILRASGGKPEGWTQRRLIGFSPVTKRTLAFVTDPNGKDLVIAKGILPK